MTVKTSWLIGISYALLAVVLGAFGAHGLKSILSAQQLASWQTAVEYQFFHGVALIVLGLLQQQLASRYLKYSGYLFAVGVLCFSGSIYGLCLSGASWLGPVTPVGGLMLISAWLLMLIAVKQKG